MKDGEWLWNTKCEHDINKKLVKMHSQKLNFPELTAEDVNFKITTICTIYADELR
jgi:hypothetical protein